MKITNKLGLPKSFVEMAKSEYAYKPKQYSVTSILRGLRETLLRRRHHDEIETDVSDMIWMLFGQATHYILEQQPEKDVELKEEYLKIPIFDGYKLSGRFDLYNDKTKCITDYKTTSIWKIIYGDYEDWRTQLCMYAWMMREIGFEVEKGEIVAILKDHKKSQVGRKADYPQYPVKRIQFEFNDKDFAGIENYIMSAFRLIQKYEKVPDDELPVCPKEKRWREPDKYAVKKKKRKRALRVLDSEEEARAWMEKKGKGDYIEYRPGEDKKCKQYCPVNMYCNYYKEQVK